MTEEVLVQLKAAMGDRYTIHREIGHGGMAVVYLAHDIKHDREVAIKVLRPELAESLAAGRFLQEIRFAANLQHPNVLPLFDSGDADGLLYYIMPYVDGGSLRHRLDREAQLPIEDAIRIARDVAAGLAHAHDQGLIHRDIKPENILLMGGTAILADFGIARAVSEAGGRRITEPNVALGTVFYMSPEQGTGSELIDSRSDLYSLGCVLYEMLAGDPPFTGRATQAIIAKHVGEKVPSLRVVRPGVPPQLVEVIEKALAKVAADRFATAHDFAAALAKSQRLPLVLKWAKAMIAGVAVAAMALFVLPRLVDSIGPNTGATDETTLTDQNRIAVLYFEDLSEDRSLGQHKSIR